MRVTTAASVLLLLGVVLSSCRDHSDEVKAFATLQRFFVAAAQDDTLTMRELAAGSQPTAFYQHYHRADPSVFDAASRTLRLRDLADGSARDDLGARFTFVNKGQTLMISAAYVRRDTVVMLRKIFVTDDM